jgi:hypothetical protein
MATILREGKVLSSNLNIPSSIQQIQQQQEQQKDEIVEECIKDVDGRVITTNRYVKGKFLGKVLSYFAFSVHRSSSHRVALQNVS